MSELPRFIHAADTVKHFVERKVDYMRPFVIRGHHLPLLFETIMDCSKEVTGRLTDSISASQNPVYREDVLGTEPSEAEQFKASVAEFLERFEHLPNRRRVRIVEQKKDGICKACAVGNHCTRIITEDVSLTSNFLTVAQNYGLTRKIRVKEEILPTSNGNEVKVRTINTNVGVIRSIVNARMAKT